jgi:predicted transcriptional regulator
MTSSEFRAALDELGMYQDQAAGFLRVTPAAVSRWASGDRPVPEWAEHVLEIAISAKTSGPVSFKQLTERSEG